MALGLLIILEQAFLFSLALPPEKGYNRNEKKEKKDDCEQYTDSRQNHRQPD